MRGITSSDESIGSDMTRGVSGTVPPTRRVRPILKLLGGLALGGAAIALVVSTAGGLSDSLSAVARMRPGFVALALAFAALRLALFARQMLLLGRRTGPLGAGTALGLALIVYGFGAITPAAPAEGLAIATHELRRRGRSKQHARMVCGFSEWFSQRTFYAIAAFDLIIVIAIGHLRLSEAWPLMIVAAVVIVALAGTAMMARLPASAIWVARVLGAIRVHRPQPPVDLRDRAASAWHAEAMAVVGPPRNRLRVAIVSAGAVLADAGTLWATCHAAGFHMHPELILLAQTVGTVVSWVPLLPGGLGLVEAAVPTILHHFGAPLAGALAATLVYRAVGALLPALVGGGAIVALRSRRSGASGPPQATP
jgi:uncharacterized protein (TIRG00374 family)